MWVLFTFFSNLKTLKSEVVISGSRTDKLWIGIALTVSFIVVLVAFFMPLFDGMNSLDYLDNLFNSISKGSAY